MNIKTLKPVVFSTSQFNYYRNNVFQQNQLLKAMQTTIDPKELRRMVGLKTVADVYRTLDKLAIRKEYHEALARNEVTLDSIVSGIKNIADTSYKDATKLKAYQVLLRSIGLDKYEDQEDTGKSWEEVLVKITEKEEDDRKESDGKEIVDVQYEVNIPVPPDEETKRREVDRELAKQLYEG